MPSPPKILVVGGGISGLACAWRLRQLGLDALLLERKNRFGGVIDTIEQEGFHFDIGPQSFLRTRLISKLIEELGLKQELVQANPRAPRYIYKDKRLQPAPLSPPQLLRTPLIGLKTKLRLLSEPLGHTTPPQDDESVAAFVRRKFGSDLLDNLVAPFISGIWAGDPERLSLRDAFPSIRQYEERYGSVLRGAIKERRKNRGSRATLCNFRSGISILTKTFAEKLGTSAQSGVEIIALVRLSNNGGFRISYRQGSAHRENEVAAIVSALPTREAARLLGSIEPAFADILAEIDYVGVLQVGAGYRIDQIALRGPDSTLNGFGFLVPRTEGLRTLGTVWNSSLFPSRAPAGEAGMVSFTSFLGGATDPQVCLMDSEQVAQIAHAELSSVLGIKGAPVTQHVVRWDWALPQYNLGHARIVNALNTLCACSPGIFLAGNYLSGPSIGACIDQANSTAESVARYCSTG